MSELQKFSKTYWNHLKVLEKAPVDIFFHLNDEKLIKVFNKGDDLDPESPSLKKYQPGAVKAYLYIQNEDYTSYINCIKSHAEKSGNKIYTKFAVEIFDNLTNHLADMSVSTPVIDTALEVSLLSLEMIEKDEDLTKLLNDQLIYNQYLCEHSFFLSLISTAICQKSAINSHSNLMKLSLASILHDISLTENASLSAVQDIHSPEYRKLENKDKKLVTHHPLASAKYAKLFPAYEIDLKRIISEHHERPDGKGFPKGLMVEQISALTIIFKIAHDLTTYMLEQGVFEENIKDIINDLRNKYYQKEFQQYIQYASECFHVF
jgi:hypothetical protein